VHSNCRLSCLITLFALKEIFAAAGPASRQLQGVGIDLAMAAQLVVNCRNKLVEMRSDNQVTGLVATWTKIISEAKSFARMHGITDVSIVERA
jgi:hypothetical protein